MQDKYVCEIALERVCLYFTSKLVKNILQHSFKLTFEAQSSYPPKIFLNCCLISALHSLHKKHKERTDIQQQL